MHASPASPRPPGPRPLRDQLPSSVSLRRCPLLVWGASLRPQDPRKTWGNPPHILNVGCWLGITQPPDIFAVEQFCSGTVPHQLGRVLRAPRDLGDAIPHAPTPPCALAPWHASPTPGHLRFSHSGGHPAVSPRVSTSPETQKAGRATSSHPCHPAETPVVTCPHRACANIAAHPASAVALAPDVL